MADKLPFKLDNPALFHDQSYVDGKWVDAKSGKRFDVYDPGNGQIWASAPNNAAEDVDAAVQAAHAAFEKYKLVNPRVRAQLLVKWDALIRANKEDLARIVTHETGKPLAEARAEIDYAASFTWWFAGEAERIYGTVARTSTPGRRLITVKQPIGVAAALVPWNFPVAMILRKCGAAFAAGCTMVVKPSPETPLSVLALAHLAAEAGFEDGVLNVLTTDLENTPAVSEALCTHELVKKVTFTGSTRVGKLVARMCADGLKKVTLELGGNCPFLVFDDADLEKAAEALMALKWRHAGQACITANRIYVQRGIYTQFTTLMASKTAALRLGHGAQESTTLGPVTTARGVQKAAELLADARDKGSRIVSSHSVPATGYFVAPSLILDATPSLQLAQEEQFSPLAAFFAFDSEAEAVAAANDTPMGLASYFFTGSVERAWRLLEGLEAGQVGMNTGPMSAAEIPFGGVKMSGYGKESGKDVAVDEYVVTKTGVLSVPGLC